MRKEPAESGDELDWVTKWRHILKYMGKPGVGKRIKRQMNRRARRRAKKESERLVTIDRCSIQLKAKTMSEQVQINPVDIRWSENAYRATRDIKKDEVCVMIFDEPLLHPVEKEARMSVKEKQIAPSPPPETMSS